MLNLMNQFFINAAILIAFITFGNLFLREKGVNRLSPLAEKIFSGVLLGILSCILMLYSVRVTPKILLDFRYIPIIIAALYVSPISAVLASLVIGVFRVIYFGLSPSSGIAFVNSLILGFGCSLIGRLPLKSWLKWICCNLSIGLVVGTTFIFLLGFSSMYFQVLIVYCLENAFVSLVMYYFMEYLNFSNQHYREMREESKIDFLTGLYNVRHFDKLSSRVFERAVIVGTPVSLLFIDIDYFKKINDSYGHLEGDGILKEVGKILTDACRNEDIVSRNGGEEFSVLLPDCPLEKAVEVAERIRQNVAMHEFTLRSGKMIQITVSIGIASFPYTTDYIENLLEQADIALYHAKRTGRNLVVVANVPKT